LETILQDIASLIVYFTLTLTNANLSDLKSQQEYLKSHIFGVIIFIFFMAFVVAAGVEETMKHFVVRCCQFPSTLKDPHSVLVYLLAAALGFATAENIEYVFGAQVPVVPGLTVLEDELLVLLMRVLTPIHAICSVLQAVNYSKVSSQLLNKNHRNINN
jgi:RsiW-degrading membrane proteinase PrsW (M82 family)